MLHVQAVPDLGADCAAVQGLHIEGGGGPFTTHTHTLIYFFMFYTILFLTLWPHPQDLYAQSETESEVVSESVDSHNYRWYSTDVSLWPNTVTSEMIDH